MSQHEGGNTEAGGVFTPVLENRDAPEGQTSDETLILDVAHALASHPEIGLAVQAGLQSDKPADMRTAWKAVHGHYGMFVDAHSGEAASPIAFKEPTVRMLGYLARGAVMRQIAPAMVQEGLIEDRNQVNAIWATLADNISGFVSPAYTNRHEYKKKLELVRFEQAFADQEPAVLVKGLLRIGGARDESIAAVSGFFSDKPAVPPNSMALRRGFSLLGQMSERAYQAFVSNVAHEDEYERRHIMQTLHSERATFEYISGAGTNGFQAAQSYKGFLEQVRRDGRDGAGIVQTGLHRMLQHYINLYSIDVSKLMAAIGLPPLEHAPALPVQPLRVRLTAKQRTNAIASMSPEEPRTEAS